MKDYLKHNFNENDPDLIAVIDELPLWSAPFGLHLLDTIRLKPNMNVLDIGCGLGFPSIEIAQRLGPSSRVFGVDPWEGAIDRIRLKISIYHIENIRPIRTVAESLPFVDNSFDLIVSNNGTNNVQDIQKTLSECYRVSKPGAQFTLSFNLEGTMIEFYKAFKETLIENNLHNEVQKMQDHIYSKRRPLDETTTLLGDSGFRIKDIQHHGFQIRFLDGSTMFNHALIKYWFLDTWKEILNPDDLENIFTSTEDKLNAIAKEKGELSLIVPYAIIDCDRR